jgi:hypothetical protein
VPRSKFLIIFGLLALLAVTALSPATAAARKGLSAAVAVQRPTAASQPQQRPSSTEAAAENYFSGYSAAEFDVDHSAPGAIAESRGSTALAARTAASDPVIAMTVNNADVYPVTPTENPRAELISQPVVNPGQEVWLHTRFLVPSNYPTVPDGGWVSLVSFYGAPFNGPSPFHLEIDGDHLQWQRNGTYEWDVPYTAPLIKGQWVDVLVHEKFATEGFLELWINGEQINFFSSGGFNPHRLGATTKLEMATMDSSNDAAPNAAKIMQYRKVGMFESGTIFFSGLQVGATRTSVGA